MKIVVSAGIGFACFMSVCQAVDIRLYSIADGMRSQNYSDGTGQNMWVESSNFVSSDSYGMLMFDTTFIGNTTLRGATLNLYGGVKTGAPTLNVHFYSNDSWSDSSIPYPRYSLGTKLYSGGVQSAVGIYPDSYPLNSLPIGGALPYSNDGRLSLALDASGTGTMVFTTRNAVSWDGSKGHEPYIDFRTWDPNATSIVNGDFDGALDFSETEWDVQSGGGNAEIIESPFLGGDSLVQMTAGSPIGITQILDTPEEAFYLLLDYAFMTETGSMELSLTDRTGASSVIGHLDSDGIDSAMGSAVFRIDDPDLLYLDHAELGIELDGSTGSQVLVDNIQFSSIPEPSGVLLFVVGAVGLIYYRNSQRGRYSRRYRR